MEVPCVRVSREEGEATRRALAEADLIDRDFAIASEGGVIYIPVSDPVEVPPEYEVVEHDVERRSTQTLPEDLLDFDASYERLGEVAIIDEDDHDRAQELADAIVESDLPLSVVLDKRSEVKGQERVRDWEILAGEGTEVVYREYGCTFELDLAEVYFSPRLATERHRVVEQVASGEQIVDMFAGVGPFAIPMAKRGATVVGVDVNETAIEYLRSNAERNDVADRVTAIHGDVREVASEYAGWADRLVMNLPHSAAEFLGAAVKMANDGCTIHYYDIQPEEDPFASGEAAIRDVAGSAGFAVEVAARRIVRSYSPQEVNICLDIRLRKTDGGNRNS